jgi:putative membrane protein
MLPELNVRLVLSAIILIVIIIILIKFRVGKTKSNAKDSLAIMKEKLDRGDITEKDYEEAKRRRGK